MLTGYFKLSKKLFKQSIFFIIPQKLRKISEKLYLGIKVLDIQQLTDLVFSLNLLATFAQA